MCSKVFAFILIMGCLASNVCYSLSVKSKTFDQLVQEADEVIQGRVVAIESRYGEGSLSHHIFTYIEFDQVKVINEVDREQGDNYQLRIVGGRVGNLVQAFPGLPSFKMGQHYVLFIRGNGRELFPLVGVYQGIFNVVVDEQGGEIIREEEEHQHILRTVTEYRALKKDDATPIQNKAELETASKFLKADDFRALIRLRWQQLRPQNSLSPRLEESPNE